MSSSGNGNTSNNCPVLEPSDQRGWHDLSTLGWDNLNTCGWHDLSTLGWDNLNTCGWDDLNTFEGADLNTLEWADFTCQLDISNQSPPTEVELEDNQTPKQVVEICEEKPKEEHKVEATCDWSLIMVEKSQADRTTWFDLVSGLNGQIPNLVKDIHEEETMKTHNLHAEEILSTEIILSESSDDQVNFVWDSNQDLSPIQCLPPPLEKKQPVSDNFMVKCADCKIWRLIPSLEKSDMIKEKLLETPFACTTAKKWAPDITCGIIQDETQWYTWCNFPRPPSGWRRTMNIRTDSTKFVDVYYYPPSGERLRSPRDVKKYLEETPKYIGVTLSQFSFKMPKRLNHVRKRGRPAKRKELSHDQEATPSQILSHMHVRKRGRPVKLKELPHDREVVTPSQFSFEMPMRKRGRPKKSKNLSMIQK